MIDGLTAASGKQYSLGKLETGHYQYNGRMYQFDYVPDALQGALHIMPHADDKMMPEGEVCCRFIATCPIWVCVLYPDIQPVLPAWLQEYERTRLNVTRQDSDAHTLKGYFSLYRKRFAPGIVTLFGNSPSAMLAADWYVFGFASGYCMYSACVVPA